MVTAEVKSKVEVKTGIIIATEVEVDVSVNIEVAVRDSTVVVPVIKSEIDVEGQSHVVPVVIIDDRLDGHLVVTVNVDFDTDVVSLVISGATEDGNVAADAGLPGQNATDSDTVMLGVRNPVVKVNAEGLLQAVRRVPVAGTGTLVVGRPSSKKLEA